MVIRITNHVHMLNVYNNLFQELLKASGVDLFDGVCLHEI
jgi:hypothetical protein